MTPERGFPNEEFAHRTSAAQDMMARFGLSALLLTTEPEVRYYTGFLTRFWESPTRSWFVVIPASGDPIAVIPSIGAHLMGHTWISDIRTWQAPDYTDDGISLLAQTLREITPKDGKIGIADQMESHVRMPLSDLRTLEKALETRLIVSDQSITRQLRLVKSDREIDKIKMAVGIADRAFDRVPEIATQGTPLSEVFRGFQSVCLDEGADWVTYLAGAADQSGYSDVIAPATDAPLAKGDVLMLDTGLVWDGYFCDFDRNFSIGPPSGKVQDAHTQVIDATNAAFDAAKPGTVMSDLFHAMDKVVNPNSDTMDAGRLGHGLGMQLTEWPSIIPSDTTMLVPGMVLTLEPSVVVSGNKILVHEENIVILEGGAEFLSTPQDRKIRVI